ncbi:MAG: cyclic pyranopterin monophosphate synthase MoaC [Desulfuromonas sp.]|nr:cyclic pyranopterin monophosphate synthase MoaC [Desulfuromonas sp.]
MAGKKLTHFDADGQAIMVDVGGKAATRRRAVARGAVTMQPATLQCILDHTVEKGDVFAVARLAGIMAAKQTPQLIPLCHPLLLSSVAVDFVPEPATGRVQIEAVVTLSGTTGVEMEALTAVAVAGLTIYDMCKAIDKTMTIDDVRLVRKEGGKSGRFVRQGEAGLV